MVNLIQKTVKRPVGRQRSGNVKTAVMRNDQIVLKEIKQIRDIRKAFAFHNNKSAQLRVI